MPGCRVVAAGDVRVAAVVDEEARRVGRRDARGRARPRRRARDARRRRARRRRSGRPARSISEKRAGVTSARTVRARDEGTVTAVARPRGAKARAATVVDVAEASSIPTCTARSTLERLRVVGRDDPVGAVHRRTREHGDAHAVREVPDAARSRGGRPRRARVDHPVDGLLPVEGEEPHRDGAGGRRTLRRRDPGRARRSRHAARGRAQDRQRACVRSGSTSRVCPSTRTSRGSRRG